MAEFFAHLVASPLLMSLGILASVFSFDFIARYAARGYAVRRELRRLTSAVKELASTHRSELKEHLDRLFSGTRAEFAWREFEETLHEQYVIADGERRISDVRATVPAESFFSTETTVDSSLNVEYFKHIPGVLTSIGIIGTFGGLITGLIEFNPNAADSTALRNSLTGLFAEVRYAFTFSAFAIGAAIVVTAIEKWLYSSCTKWLGTLTQQLDALFRAGVGEEYLSSLVQASHESATQVRQLKESLVDDLKALLTNLTDRQIQATQQLSTDLTQRLEESLQAPLERIAETVRVASGQQNESAAAVMENLMTSFLAQMREAFGGQVGDLTQLMQQAAGSMNQVEASIRSLVSDIQRASQESSASAQTSMRELMSALAEHQQSQARSVASSTQVVMDKLQATVQRMAEAQEQASRQASASAQTVSDAMQTRIAALTEANSVTLQSTRDTVAGIASTSADAIHGLSSGTARITAALEGLSQTIERLSHVADKVGQIETRSAQTAQTIGQASAALGTAAQSLSTSINSLSRTTDRMELVSKSMGTEADARATLLRDLREITSGMQNAGTKLVELQKQAEKTLTAAMEEFGTGVNRIVTSHLNAYQKQLGDAVSMLQGALHELAEFASEAQG